MLCVIGLFVLAGERAYKQSKANERGVAETDDLFERIQLLKQEQKRLEQQSNSSSGAKGGQKKSA